MTVQRRGLNREQVVKAALQLLDEEGMDGLTMRRLAEALKVQAPSLYNHIRDKNQLLALLADAMSGEIRPPNPEGPWREELGSLARDYRRVLKSRRDSARVFAATPPFGHRRLQLIEQLLELLARAGFSEEAMAHASFAFNSYVVGFVLDETQASPSEAQDTATADRWIEALPKDRYPRQAALIKHFSQAQPDRAFEFGLRAFIDGLAQHLPSRSRTQGRR